MKKVILILWFMPLPALCQVSENFETGTVINWVQCPAGRWAADNTASLNGYFSLHHTFDNSDAGTDLIALPLVNLHPEAGITRWSFLIRHGYDPSSSNSWAVFLTSDKDPSEILSPGRVNGFAVGVNISGYDDTLRLMKMKEGNPLPVVTTRINWQNNIGISAAVRISVERSRAGNWKVIVYSTDGSVIGSSENSDPELFTIRWMAVQYRYSSTRDRLLWIDDINVDGVFISDTVPPSVYEVSVTGRNSIEISLDEEPAVDFMNISNFILNNNGSAVISTEAISRLRYRIKFSEGLINKNSNTLVIKRICDDLNNCSENVRLNFLPVWAEPGDIVISEVMADPLPPVSLPTTEYLELKNNTTFPVWLTGWKLKTRDGSATFPGVKIGPGEYLVVCQVTDTALFKGYGNTAGLKYFPVLTDAGKCIVLTDSSDNLIHGVEYSDKWYGNVLKSGGGWSLEMVDVTNPFNPESNWKASVSRSGGTPGKTNSVDGKNPDISFLGITNIFPQNDRSLLVTFSEPVKNMTSAADKIFLEGGEILFIKPLDPLCRSFDLETENPLVAGNIYDIKLPGDLKDFAGNLIKKRHAAFGLPETAEKGDIVFNELLFNPAPGFPDYIEFANNSAKTIDPSALYIASVNDETGDTSTLYSLSDQPLCILPGTLYTVTTDKDALISRYIPVADTCIFELHQLPSMADDRGHLLLFNRYLDIIDEVRYDESMHYSLLNGTEGISLEKVRPGDDSSIRGNWHSASESSGWGTPGSPNSNVPAATAEGDRIELLSTRISPDNDGYEDLLVIEFNLESYGNILSVKIFDEGGNLVRKLAQSLLAGTRTSLSWDGTADDGTLVRTGIYIIYISLIDDRGKNQTWKRVCTLAR